MGANTSKQDTDIFKKNVTDASVNILNKTLSSTDNRALGSATQKISFVGSTIECPQIAITNTVNLQSRVFNQMSDQQESDLQQQLQTQMESLIQKSLEQSNSKFNLFQVNKTSTSAKLREEVYHDLSTTIAKETRQAFNNDVSAIASQDISFRDTYITCIPPETPGQTQGFLIKQDVNLENVVENVMNSAKVDQIIAEAADTLDFTEETEVAQANVGSEPLKVLAEAFTSLAVMIPVIIAVVAIVGLIIFSVAGKKAWGMNPFVYVWRKMTKKDTATGKPLPKSGSYGYRRRRRR